MSLDAVARGGLDGTSASACRCRKRFGKWPGALLLPGRKAYIAPIFTRGLHVPICTFRRHNYRRSVRFWHQISQRPRTGACRPRAPGYRLSYAPIVQRERPRWSTSMPPRRCRTAIRCWTIRSSAASSACPARAARADAALARLRRDRRCRRLVVTNNHVIEGADQVKISLADKREFEAEIVLKDRRTDLAVLRSRTARSASRCWSSPIPTSCRSATWCSRSAIRSASARP